MTQISSFDAYICSNSNQISGRKIDFITKYSERQRYDLGLYEFHRESYTNTLEREHRIRRWVFLVQLSMIIMETATHNSWAE